MAATTQATPVTIADYLKFKSPQGFLDELIFGEIIVSPEPKVLHFQIADNLYKLLSGIVGKRYRVAQRINLRFPAVKSMPSPDVFVITQEAFNAALKANKYPEGKHTLLAVEVISPGNRKKNVDLKVELYRSFGIETWVVNPKRQEVKVHADNLLTHVIGQSIPLTNLGSRKIASVADIFKLPE